MDIDILNQIVSHLGIIQVLANRWTQNDIITNDINYQINSIQRLICTNNLINNKLNSSKINKFNNINHYRKTFKPKRRKTKINKKCKFYRNGFCRFGNYCKYIHKIKQLSTTKYKKVANNNNTNTDLIINNVNENKNNNTIHQNVIINNHQNDKNNKNTKIKKDKINKNVKNNKNCKDCQNKRQFENKNVIFSKF